MEEGVADGIEWEATIKRDLHHWGNLNWRSEAGGRRRKGPSKEARAARVSRDICDRGCKVTGGQAGVYRREDRSPGADGGAAFPCKRPSFTTTFSSRNSETLRSGHGPCGGFTILQSGREGTTNQPGHCPNHGSRKLLSLVYTIYLSSLGPIRMRVLLRGKKRLQRSGR